MAYKISYTHTFGGLSSPVPLSYLDANYTDVLNAMASLNTYGNYLVDGGAVNTYAVTLDTGTTATLTAGLPFQIKIANSNTGASTLAFNGGAAKSIKTQAGAALIANQLLSGGVYLFQYDGTNYQVLNPSAPITSGRIPYASTGGLIIDSAAMTFNGTTFNLGPNKFTVDVTNGNTHAYGTLTVDQTVSCGDAFGYYLTQSNAGYWFNSIGVRQDGIFFDGSNVVIRTNNIDTALTLSSAGLVSMAPTINNNICALIRNSGVTTPYGLWLNFSAAAPNDTTRYFAKFEDSSAARCYIFSNGNLQNTNNSYGAISDVKLKQDIAIAGSQLNDVYELSKLVSKFHLRSDPTGPLLLGFVAGGENDVAEISPGLVYETEDTSTEEYKDNDGKARTRIVPTGTVTKGVHYSVAYMKAFKATGELIGISRNHESRLSAAESWQQRVEKALAANNITVQ